MLSIWSVELHCSVESVANLRTEDRWFDPRLGQYSFLGLMMVIATGFIPLSPLSVGLERKLCGVPFKRTQGKHG